MVDVMITIFSDIRQFSAKNMALFLKTNVNHEFLPKLFVFLTTTPIFSRKYLKNHNIGP
jgi:hypothetical protein